MHSFVPIASTQHMVGGVCLLLTKYLQCTAVIVNSLYIKFKCFWALQVIDLVGNMISVIIDGYFHDDTLWVLSWLILLVANDSFGNR